jgi:hypothetical protein
MQAGIFLCSGNSYAEKATLYSTRRIVIESLGLGVRYIDRDQVREKWIKLNSGARKGKIGKSLPTMCILMDLQAAPYTNDV